MELYLIRHAQSENNLAYSQNSSERVADPALTSLGERQASLLASYLAERPDPLQRDGRTNYSNQFGFYFTHLICSPMRRALQTAGPLAQALQLPVEVWIDIYNTGISRLELGADGRVGVLYLNRLPHLPPELVTA